MRVANSKFQPSHVTLTLDRSARNRSDGYRKSEVSTTFHSGLLGPNGTDRQTDGRTDGRSALFCNTPLYTNSNNNNTVLGSPQYAPAQACKW